MSSEMLLYMTGPDAGAAIATVGDRQYSAEVIVDGTAVFGAEEWATIASCGPTDC